MKTRVVQELERDFYQRHLIVQLSPECQEEQDQLDRAFIADHQVFAAELLSYLNPAIPWKITAISPIPSEDFEVLITVDIFD